MEFLEVLGATQQEQTTVAVDYSMSLKDMIIKCGNFTMADKPKHDEIEDLEWTTDLSYRELERFGLLHNAANPLPKDKSPVEVEWADFNRPIETPEILKTLERYKYRPANLAELIAASNTFSAKNEGDSLVALGSYWTCRSRQWCTTHYGRDARDNRLTAVVHCAGRQKRKGLYFTQNYIMFSRNFYHFAVVRMAEAGG